MKNSLKIIFILALIASNFSYAGSASENCKASSEIGKSWAMKRGNGKTVKEVFASIDKIAETNSLSDGDVEMAKFMVNLVYIDLKSYSPDQVQKYIYRNCMTEAK